MKRIKLIALMLSIVSLLFITACGNSSSDSEKIQIGISQIVEYRALDEAREGFIKALNDKGYVEGENLELDIQNAQGEMTATQTIAQSFKNKKKDLIFAISTPSSQAAYNATKDIPIIMTAVTDPVEAGLVKSLENPETNVSGTSDYIPIEKQLDLIKALKPETKSIGVIYNTSEINSEIQVEQLRKAADKYNLKVVATGISTSNEVNQAITSIISKIDCLYIPTDQMIVSAIPIILQKTLAEKIPVIAAEKGSVENGALATQGISYELLGYKSGLMAVEVLEGKNIKEMPVEFLEETEIIINETSLEKLGLDKPNLDNVIYIK